MAAQKLQKRRRKNKPDQRPNASERSSWKCMIARCYRNSCASYATYGAVGITVCQRLRAFPDFFDDLGPKPSHQYQIEREKNERGYWCGRCSECQANGWPRNVRWATSAEQQRNTSKCRWLEHDGRTLCLADWSIETGLSASTIVARIDQFGWPVERALTEPPSVRRTQPQRRATMTAWGLTLSYDDWSRWFGVGKKTIRSRTGQMGLTPEEALTLAVYGHGSNDGSRPESWPQGCARGHSKRRCQPVPSDN